jgi:peroxiredoxin
MPSIRWLLAAILGGTILGTPAPALDIPGASRLGRTIADFTLPDASGKPLALSDFNGRKAIVVVFLSFECPMSTNYAPVLADLADAYGNRGVAFLGVCCQQDADAAQVAQLAQDFKIPFPVRKDPHHVAAEALEATVTPEVFVLDSQRILRYRGRIDNTYAARLQKNVRTTRHDLRQALEELLAGKPVSTPSTPPIGCPIHSAQAAPATGTITFYRHVLPILQNHCQQCHRPGEVAPFALMTYKQAVNWAGDIKTYTQNRQMPPWKPVEGGPFHGERKLTDQEIATLAAWVEGGTPAGHPDEAPPPRHFGNGWQLGPPDLVLTMPDDFYLGPTGPDLYRYFVLPTNLPEDKYVTALEVRPGNRRIVHHAVLFADSKHWGRRLEEAEQKRSRALAAGDHGPGYTWGMGVSVLPGFLPQGGLGGWAPGMVYRHFPAGNGYYLPRGADVIFQLHYFRSGRVEKDRTSVGLYFSKNPKAKHMQGLAIPAQFMSIPAGAERYRVEGHICLKQDCQVHVVAPHMHLIGREITMTMRPPNGPARTLLVVKAWDFNWQEEYFLREPIRVKAGTRFDVEGIFDNSARNPRNPFQPPQTVLFGLETTNEMCVGFLGATSDQPGPIRFDIEVKVPSLEGSRIWSLPALGL